MGRLAPSDTPKLAGPACRGCEGPMRLFGIEPHPTVERTELRTYVCSDCDEVETEIVSLH
jgi:hypothetical protein